MRRVKSGFRARLVLAVVAAAIGMLNGVKENAAQGAVVTYSTPTAVTGTSSIFTGGTFVHAINLGDSAAKTVNGVTFAGEGATEFVAFGGPVYPYTGYLGGTSTGDSELDSLLDSGEYSFLSGGTLTLTGLTPSTNYVVQLLFVDKRSGAEARSQTFVGGNSEVAFPALTQSILGSFVADATTQDIVIMNGGGGGEPVTVELSGYQVRAAALPEPASLATLGIATFGLIARRRTR